jgi:uncharacterized repeat protein (TIGR02543 family)
MKKRILSVIMAVVMVVTIIPLVTIQTQANNLAGFRPISTPEDLRAITSGNFYLTNDIDLSNWGIWQSSIRFSGIFDGNGFAIRNLTSTSGGLFNFISAGSTVRNLGLVDVNARMGALANEAFNGITVENVYVTGIVTNNGNNSSWDRTAGFVGEIIGFNNLETVFKNCYNGATVTHRHSRVAGITTSSTVQNPVTFINCVNGGTVIRGDGYGSAITEILGNQMVSCYNFGVAGSLVGTATAEAFMRDCATIGDIAIAFREATSIAEARTNVPLEEFKQQSTYVGFDFNNIWYISPERNDGFPILRIMLPKYNFNITAEAGGTVSGGGFYTQGDQVTLRAVPGTGHTFNGWFTGNTRVSSETTLTYTAESNITLQARFTPNQYTFNITAGAGGTVNGGGTHNHGASVNLRAVPNRGFSFSGWFDGNSLFSTEISFFVTATGNRTLQARFSPTPGRVLGNDTVNINDALEILKYLAKLDSVIHPQNNARAFNAARITTPGVGTPTINDALEILKHLAKLPSLVR